MPIFLVSGRDEKNEPAAYEIEAADENDARRQAAPLLTSIETVELQPEPEPAPQPEPIQTILTSETVIRARYAIGAGNRAEANPFEIKKRRGRMVAFLSIWSSVFFISLCALLLIFSNAQAQRERFATFSGSGRWVTDTEVSRFETRVSFGYVIAGILAFISFFGGLWTLITLVNLSKTVRFLEARGKLPLDNSVETPTGGPVTIGFPVAPVRPVPPPTSRS